MYSVVLMMALTTGSATPDWHHRGGCCGGSFGCFGGCCGGGCFGCWGGCGGGCYGCCGGGCYGCCGGCFGGCCGGCGGGCFGGGSGVGISDGFADGYGAPMSSGAIVPGDGMIAPGTGVYPDGLGAPTNEPLGTPKENKGKDRDKTGQGTVSSTSAKLVVEVPANAKLFVDDMPLQVAAGVRTLHTPALQPGQVYYYIVRIERMHDGKPVSETRRIIVHAGLVARVDFNDLESAAVRTAQAK